METWNVKYCHTPNDNTTQHNLNTVVGLDMKMTVQTPPTTPPQKLKGDPQETQAIIDHNSWGLLLSLCGGAGGVFSYPTQLQCWGCVVFSWRWGCYKSKFILLKLVEIAKSYELKNTWDRNTYKDTTILLCCIQNLYHNTFWNNLIIERLI